MAKKNQMKRAATSGEVRNREFCIGLMKTGEVLGDELMEQLSQHGSSFEGLVIETYAMSKAWGALLAIAHCEGFDAEDLFERLLPSFVKDMEDCINATEEEEKK